MIQLFKEEDLIGKTVKRVEQKAMYLFIVFSDNTYCAYIASGSNEQQIDLVWYPLNLEA